MPSKNITRGMLDGNYLPHSKPVTWRGQQFNSIADASKVIGYNHCTVGKHLKMYGTIDHLDVKDKGSYDSASRNGGKTVECIYKNKVFESFTEASKYLNVSLSIVSKHHYFYGNLNKLKKMPKPTLTFFDVPFPTKEKAATDLCRSKYYVGSTLAKFGNLDTLIPGKDSIYYDKSLDPSTGDCFIKEAIEIFGLKAVARMYGTEPKRLRTLKNSDTLWKLRTEVYDDTDRPVKFKTRDELFHAMVNPPRRPYVYMLSWGRKRVRYVGSRTAEHCSPDEVGKTYFSSSRKVAAYIRDNGYPTNVYTMEFDSVHQTLFAEGFLLMLISSAPKFQKHYLNKVLWIPNLQDPWQCRGSRNDFLVRCGDGELKRKRQLLELLLTE